MKRTLSNKDKKPTAILSGDIHLTDSVPVSRVDDYLEAQYTKLKFLKDLQKKWNCPVWDAGDVFDYWKASPWLLSRAHQMLPDMVTIPGNHDMPEHNLNLFMKSALWHQAQVRPGTTVLGLPGLTNIYQQGDEYVIVGLPYDQLDKFDVNVLFNQPDFPEGVETFVLMLHEFIWPGKTPPWKGAPGYSAQEILKRFSPYFDVIVTSDNHQSFVETYKDTILVNPGAMMRDDAGTVNDKPRCYLYYADTNTVVPAYYPIKEGVHDISYLEGVKERDARIEAYIAKITHGTDGALGLSFETNLESFFKSNNTPKKIKELIWHHMELV